MAVSRTLISGVDVERLTVAASKAELTRRSLSYPGNLEDARTAVYEDEVKTADSVFVDHNGKEVRLGTLDRKAVKRLLRDLGETTSDTEPKDSLKISLVRIMRASDCDAPASEGAPSPAHSPVRGRGRAPAVKAPRRQDDAESPRRPRPREDRGGFERTDEGDLPRRPRGRENRGESDQDEAEDRAYDRAPSRRPRDTDEAAGASSASRSRHEGLFAPITKVDARAPTSFAAPFGSARPGLGMLGAGFGSASTGGSLGGLGGIGGLGGLGSFGGLGGLGGLGSGARAFGGSSLLGSRLAPAQFFPGAPSLYQPLFQHGRDPFQGDGPTALATALVAHIDESVEVSVAKASRTLTKLAESSGRFAAGAAAARELNVCAVILEMAGIVLEAAADSTANEGAAQRLREMGQVTKDVASRAANAVHRVSAGISYTESRETHPPGGLIKADKAYYEAFQWTTPLEMLPTALAAARDAGQREVDRRAGDERAGARRADANRDNEQGAPRRSPRKSSPPPRR